VISRTDTDRSIHTHCNTLCFCELYKRPELSNGAATSLPHNPQPGGPTYSLSSDTSVCPARKALPEATLPPAQTLRLTDTRSYATASTDFALNRYKEDEHGPILYLIILLHSILYTSALFILHLFLHLHNMFRL
jgi:hypothetical protein